MKQTPNINLPILEQGDKYLKETQNEAFSVIDREIAGLNSAISALDNSLYEFLLMVIVLVSPLIALAGDNILNNDNIDSLENGGTCH